MSTPRPDKHVAKLIERKLGFTNGWSVPSNRYRDMCLEVAREVLKYLERRSTTLRKVG